MKTDCGPILVVDGDPSFRTLTCRLFEQAGFATRGAASGERAMSAAREIRPRLVLLDVTLPDVNGFELCRRLRDEFGEALPIIFVSGDRTEPHDRAAGLLIGGDDYVVKPFDPDELLARARRLIARSSGESTWSARSVRNGAALTSRELEVLRLLAEGTGAKQIASELVISPKTVASHVQRIVAKLGVHSRAEAIAMAYRDGLVSVPARTDDEAEVLAHLVAVA